jgi:hypothetical protein
VNNQRSESVAVSAERFERKSGGGWEIYVRWLAQPPALS